MAKERGKTEFTLVFLCLWVGCGVGLAACLMTNIVSEAISGDHVRRALVVAAFAEALARDAR